MNTYKQMGINPDTARFHDERGNTYDKKPEYMTQLHGNLLVRKDHPRIALRGKLDSFQAALIEAQFIASEMREEALLAELTEILEYSRALMRAEVLESPFETAELLGMDEETLRRVSHDPQKHIGVPHYLPDYTMGVAAIALNALRTAAREVEIAAICAFCADEESAPQREDILRGMNRLSSALYIITCKQIAKNEERTEAK